MHTIEPSVERPASVLIRDLLIFQLKLAIDGLKDIGLMQLAVAAAVADLIATGGRRPRFFYAVLTVSERFDLWLNLNEGARGAGTDPEGLFGGARAVGDSMLSRLEQLLRSRDEREAAAEA